MILEWWTLVAMDNKYDHDDPYAVKVSVKHNVDDADYTWRDCISLGICAKMKQIHTRFDTNDNTVLSSNVIREWSTPLRKQVELNAKAKTAGPTIKKRTGSNFFGQAGNVPQGLQPVYPVFMDEAEQLVAVAPQAVNPVEYDHAE